MRKALLVTHVSGFVPQFEMNNVHILQNMGYEVHYASNFHNPSYGDDNSRLEGTGIICHQIDFERSPFKRKNITAYRQLKKLMEEHEFDLVHCHTPMGGALARLAAHNTHTGPVIYTAHGFHFFKGAPLINWMIYYPVECYLSRYTDVLICINVEDYKRAKKHFYTKNVVRIPGVGLDIERIESTIVNTNQKKEQLGIQNDEYVLLSVGEMTANKNHELVLRALKKLNNKKIKYLLCGHGEEEKKLKNLVTDLQLNDQVLFLGYRKDVFEIYRIADIFVFPSIREGMPVALMEAMASNLPVICSNIRGNRELIKNDFGGRLIEGHNIDDYARAIADLAGDREKCLRFGQYNALTIRNYDKSKSLEIMKQVYRELCK